MIAVQFKYAAIIMLWPTDSGSSVEAHQLQQLQVLYDARGHKIADVMGEFSVYKDTTEREMRGLQHKCTMLQGT